jgi:hypothetical protein
MAYHPDVRGGSRQLSSLTSNIYYAYFDIFLLTILNTFFIIALEQLFAFTMEVRQVKTYKDKIINILDKLNPKQVEYIYHLIASLFGHASD